MADTKLTQHVEKRNEDGLFISSELLAQICGLLSWMREMDSLHKFMSLMIVMISR